MKSLNALAMMAVVLLVGALASESAFAHRGGRFHGGAIHKSRVVVGIGVGVPLYWGPWWYYPPPAYYYPPYYYRSYSPPVYSAPTYIERADEEAAPAEQSSQWWYYCADSKAYYPYVKECPGGWQRVAPQPPPPPR